MVRILLTLTFVATSAWAAPKLLPGKPIVDARDCILQIMAAKMEITLDDRIQLPTIRPETTTSLQYFQDSIEAFWKQRPEFFLNVYNPLKNEIFIMTEAAYYKKHKRSVFDSLAHELVHYLQKEYRNADFISADEDHWEIDAIHYQTWFRETFQKNFKNNKFICPL